MITPYVKNAKTLQKHLVENFKYEEKLTQMCELITETEDLIYLDSDMSVNIKNDEAGRLYVKRPHTISGYTVKYFITYKNRGDLEI